MTCHAWLLSTSLVYWVAVVLPVDDWIHMADELDIAPMMAFARNPRFRELLRESKREYLPWERLLELPLPDGLSAVDTWNVIGAFRRIDAIINPVTDMRGRVFWYAPTQRINASVSRIAEACREGSLLQESIGDSSNGQLVVRLRIEEAVACARMDGFVIPLDETLRTLGQDRVPRTAGEHLVANLISLARDMDERIGEPYSPGLLRELHDRLLDGVDMGGLTVADPWRETNADGYTPDELIAHADEQMEKICAFANGVDADPFDHPIVRALVIWGSVRGYRPLPHLSVMVARLVFIKYALEARLQALSVLPLAKAWLEWENNNRAVKPFKDVSRYTALIPYPDSDEVDMTPFITISAQLTLQTLEELEAELERGNKRDREMRELLHENQLLNHRQRSVLSRALRDPDAEFGIRYHRTKHNIAYATARADLLGLANMGYLAREERGQAFVFRRGPRLDELIAQRQSEADSKR